MHQTLAVQERQGLESRRQQFAHFIGSEGPLLQDLSERLLCVLHDHEEKLMASELAQTRVES